MRLNLLLLLILMGPFWSGDFCFFFRRLVRLAADFAHSDTPPGLVLKKKNAFWEEWMEEKTVTIIKLSHHDALAHSDCNL